MAPYEVCIVGAGVSGLKAAQTLAKYGVDFVVLEGSDRTGGRVLTDKSGLAPYDLGASWFHDTLSNPLFDEVKQESERYGLFYDDGKPFYVTEHGVDLEKHKVPQVSREMEKYIELRFFESIDMEDVSLEAMCGQFVESQAGLLTETQRKYAPAMLRQLELWHGVSWDKMSSKYALVDNVGRNCLVRKGYAEVLAGIESDIPKDRIRLSQVVRHIKRNGGDYMVVKTDTEEIQARWVIVTVPQSILQLEEGDGAIEWEPPFPQFFRESLSRMSFGTLGKFIFEFDAPFWPENDRFVVIPSSGTDSVWGHPVLMLNFQASSGVPAVLCFTQGETTIELEAHPERAWAYFEPVFEKISQAQVRKPTKVISTSWTLNPLARGSYAACEPGDDPVDVAITLSQGLGNLRFAGEHTILDGAGAVHGAWLSGKREAEHILREMGHLS